MTIHVLQHVLQHVCMHVGPVSRSDIRHTPCADARAHCASGVSRPEADLCTMTDKNPVGRLVRLTKKSPQRAAVLSWGLRYPKGDCYETPIGACINGGFDSHPDVARTSTT